MHEEGLGMFMSGNSQGNDSSVELLTAAFVMDLLIGLEPWLDVETACNFPCSLINCTESQKPHNPVEKYYHNLQKLTALAKELPKLALKERQEGQEEYIGEYSDPGYGSMKISQTQEGKLWFEFNEIEGEVAFVAKEAFVKVEYWYNLVLPLVPLVFNRDANNEIVSVTIPAFEPKAPPTFDKA